MKRLNARLKALHEQAKKGTVQTGATTFSLPSSPRPVATALPQSAASLSSHDVMSCSTSRHASVNSEVRTESTGTEENKPSVFHVDRSRIAALSNEEQGAELQQLQLSAVYNQEEFEQGRCASVQ